MLALMRGVILSSALLACSFPSALCQAEIYKDQEMEEEVKAPKESPKLSVKVSTKFPESEVFGVKLVNGHPTVAHLSITNGEPEPVTIQYVGGSLWNYNVGPQGPIQVRNLTTSRYNVEMAPGVSESIKFKFTTELHPQDLQLNLAAVIANSKGVQFTVSAFNETVGIVEPDASIFDPQIIFLYLFLGGLLGGTCYFIYTTWMTTFFPQQRKGGKGGERARRSLGGNKVNPSEQVSVIGDDGPAVTSGAKAYDESWIPAHHINRPAAQRVKSGGKSKGRGKQED